MSAMNTPPDANRAAAEERLRNKIREVVGEIGRIDTAVKPALDSDNLPGIYSRGRSRTYVPESGSGASLNIRDFKVMNTPSGSSYEYLPGDRMVTVEVDIADEQTGQVVHVRYEMAVRDADIKHTERLATIVNERAIEEANAADAEADTMSGVVVPDIEVSRRDENIDIAQHAEYLQGGEFTEVSYDKVLEALRSIK
jgi:hypothetical protein